jgi:hypothetical protein
MITIKKFFVNAYIGFMRFLVGYTAAAVIGVVVYSFWLMWLFRDLQPLDGGTSLSDHYNDAINMSSVVLIFLTAVLLPVWIVLAVTRPKQWTEYPWFFGSGGVALWLLLGYSFTGNPPPDDETNFGAYFSEHIHNWPGLLPAGLAFGLTYWAVSDRLLRSRPSSG